MTGPAPRRTEVVLSRLRWWQIEGLLALEEELFAPEHWSAELFWSELAQGELRYYVVAQDAGGAVLGYAGLATYGDEANVQTLGVTTTAQGQGIGGRLLDDLLRAAAARGARSVGLEVRAGNALAQAMYRSRGFQPVRVRKRYYERSGEDAVVMNLDLPAGAP